MRDGMSSDMLLCWIGRLGPNMHVVLLCERLIYADLNDGTPVCEQCGLLPDEAVQDAPVMVAEAPCTNSCC